MDEIAKYFPAFRPLAKILVFSLRLTGSIFGLVFAGIPSYLIWKFVLPVYADPLRTSGERWGATAFALFGLCFVVAGLFVLRDSLFRTSLPGGAKATRHPPKLPERREMLERARFAQKRRTFGIQKLPGGGVTWSSAHLYRIAGIAVGVFALFWNGITYYALFDLRHFGHLFSVFHAVFMLPFLTVGFGLAYVFFKIILSLRQPTLEFHLPKERFARGESFRVELRLKDARRLARGLELRLRKRYLKPEDEGGGLSTEAWVVEERILLERRKDELDFEWSDSITLALPGAEAGENEEWSEWSLEAKIETGGALPLYMMVPLPYELGET